MKYSALLGYLCLLCSFMLVGPCMREEQDWSIFSDEASDAYHQKNWRCLTTLTNPTSITLYEGLPHQLYENKELESELKTKPVAMINNFPYYNQRIELTKADQQKLRDFFSHEEFFWATHGSKGCGGFHPDFCLQWTTHGGLTVNCHLCFGCSELKLYDRKREFDCDVYSLPLEIILLEYRNKRPITKHYQRLIDFVAKQKSQVR